MAKKHLSKNGKATCGAKAQTKHIIKDSSKITCANCKRIRDGKSKPVHLLDADGTAHCGAELGPNALTTDNMETVTCQNCRRTNGTSKVKPVHYSVIEGKPICGSNAKNPELTDNADKVTCQNCLKAARAAELRTIKRGTYVLREREVATKAIQKAIAALTRAKTNWDLIDDLNSVLIALE